MTEEEAKTKECCRDRSVDCAASKCMGWRWYRTHIHNPANPAGDLIPSTDTHGFCGLAGHWFEHKRAGAPQ